MKNNSHVVFVINNKDIDRIKAFGKRLKKIRTNKGFSQRTLALECEIEKSQIIRIEQGKINTTINTVFILADALKINPKELFDFNVEEENTSLKS